nr:MAG TPA: hypothetical protein [Caudoviricetes sp.]
MPLNRDHGGTRTHNLVLRTHLLYPLSYTAKIKIIKNI